MIATDCGAISVVSVIIVETAEICSQSGSAGTNPNSSQGKWNDLWYLSPLSHPSCEISTQLLLLLMMWLTCTSNAPTGHLSVNEHLFLHSLQSLCASVSHTIRECTILVTEFHSDWLHVEQWQWTMHCTVLPCTGDELWWVMEEGPPFNLRIELHQFESFLLVVEGNPSPAIHWRCGIYMNTVTIWWLLLLLLLVTDLFNNGRRVCKSIAITELNIYFNANWLQIYSQISQIIMSSSAGM